MRRQSGAINQHVDGNRALAHRCQQALTLQILRFIGGFAIASVGKSNDGSFDAPTQFLDYVLCAFDQFHSLVNQLVISLKVAVANHNTVPKTMMRSDRIFRI